jgi:hypothetical protein
MAREAVIGDREIYEAALIGLQSQLSKIDEAMSGIRSRLGIRSPRRPVTSTDGIETIRTKRKMTAAARKRISEATRKRWMAFRKAKAQAEAPAAKPKRKMSAVGRARIIAATKKRWAAIHKAQTAAAKTSAT